MRRYLHGACSEGTHVCEYALAVDIVVAIDAGWSFGCEKRLEYGEGGDCTKFTCVVVGGGIQALNTGGSVGN